MKNRIILVLFLLFVVGIASCGKKEEAVPEKISTVTGVKVETVKASPVEDFYEAVGTVRSKTASVLSPKITGYILAVHVREGDSVTPGRLLIEIDNREASAQLEKGAGRGVGS